MRANHYFKVHRFVLIAALAMGFGSVSSAVAQQGAFFIVDINSKAWIRLNLDKGPTEVADINDFGQVAGWFETGTQDSSHAFLTGFNGKGMTDLGNLGENGSYDRSEAHDVNNAGQVAGWSYTYYGWPHAFITGPNGLGMTDLGTLGGIKSLALGINDFGQVVGMSETARGEYHAFITGPNGIGMRDLGKLGGDESRAYGINEAGQVVGNSESSEDYDWHAFITGPNGVGMRNLDTLGGTASWASGINDSGEVVGASYLYQSYDWHAFVTGPNGMGMINLGTLGGDYSYAVHINDSGQVVGESETATGELRAFIVDPNDGRMTDLNSLVDLPDEIILDHAVAINDLGQILAYDALPIPEPDSYALLLTGLGLVGFMAQRKKSENRI